MDKLTNTKDCSKCCYYNMGICIVDNHITFYREQAYSCKYYKKHKKENENKDEDR